MARGLYRQVYGTFREQTNVKDNTATGNDHNTKSRNVLIQTYLRRLAGE